MDSFIGQLQSIRGAIADNLPDMLDGTMSVKDVSEEVLLLHHVDGLLALSSELAAYTNADGTVVA